jgi:hypothetical protein
LARGERAVATPDDALAVWYVLPPGCTTPDSDAGEVLAQLLTHGHSVLAVPADAPLGQQLARDKPDLIHAQSLAAAAALAAFPAPGHLPPVIVDCARGQPVADPLARFLASGAVDCILVADAPTKQRLVIDAAIDPGKVHLRPHDAAGVASLYRHVIEQSAERRQLGSRGTPPPFPQPPN